MPRRAASLRQQRTGSKLAIVTQMTESRHSWVQKPKENLYWFVNGCEDESGGAGGC